jgi:integral membrane protein
VRKTVFTAYRVMSYVTGVGLAILVFVGVPLEFIWDKPQVDAVVGTAHGFLFMLYVLLVLVLGYLAHWSVGKILWVAAAGTIPLAVFFVEPRVRRTELAERAAAQAGGGTGSGCGTSPPAARRRRSMRSA